MMLRIEKLHMSSHNIWTVTQDFGTHLISEQWRLRQVCELVQSCYSLGFSHTLSIEVDGGYDQKLGFTLFHEIIWASSLAHNILVLIKYAQNHYLTHSFMNIHAVLHPL